MDRKNINMLTLILILFLQIVLPGCYNDIAGIMQNKDNMIKKSLLLFSAPTVSPGGGSPPTDIPPVPNLDPTYYVDFDSGNDSYSGTSISTAWKHCPGDSNATGIAKSTTLNPDDVIAFKGGVAYRGLITVPDSGTSGHYIQFRGDLWGTNKAIIDGSKPLTGWTQCTSANQCGGNTNYANIYYAYIAAADYINYLSVNLHEGDNFCYLSQTPNQPNPLFWDDITTYYRVPLPYSNTTSTSITDSTFFTQSDSTYWDGSCVAIWHSPNQVATTPIVSFNPTAHRITFASQNVYTTMQTLYAIRNSLHAIDRAGEFYVKPTAEADGTHKIYVWPYNTSNLTSRMTISVRKNGFILNNKNYITIQGFTIQKFTGTSMSDGTAIKITKGTGIIVHNNTLKHNYSSAHGFGYGSIFLSGCTNSTISNNTISESVGHIGIFSYSNNSNLIISDNTIYYPGHTAIVTYNSKYLQIIRNTVIGSTGAHANGITAYLSNQYLLIAWNKVSHCNNPITFQENKDVYFYRNFIDSYGNTTGWGAIDWGGESGLNGNVYFLNNTFVRSSNHMSCNIGTNDYARYITRNNIFDGGGTGSNVDRDYNLYVGLGWNQTASHGWYVDTHGLVDTDDSHTFINYTSSAGDFHLKTGSPAINKGTDITPFLPTSFFPNVNFWVDIDGNPINKDNRDLGAYIWH